MNKIETMLFEQTKNELIEKITSLQSKLANFSDKPQETLNKKFKTFEILPNIDLTTTIKLKIIKFITETNNLYVKEIKTTYRQPFNYFIQAKNELAKNKEAIKKTIASANSYKNIVKGG
ncbi:MAG: hypothetical protein VB048_00510 [Bacteroidaceae bacterium]|nr:hypothetical protein [Bacteroidaceae bacterium]